MMSRAVRLDVPAAVRMATLISPPPARKAARAARCGAPVSPSEPPTIKNGPAVPLPPRSGFRKAPAMAS